LLKNVKYIGIEPKTDKEDCEHVYFHKDILDKYPNTRIVIVPYMFN